MKISWNWPMQIPDLFSPLLSIRERLRINKRIEGFLKAHREDEQQQLILLCLISLGARPFAGTLSLSLYEIFEANPRSRMCDLTWPEMFPSSSLRFVDRICTKQTAISAQNFTPMIASGALRKARITRARRTGKPFLDSARILAWENPSPKKRGVLW